MVKGEDLGYETISFVLDSWEALRRVPNYQEVAGVVLFQKYVHYFFVLKKCVVRTTLDPHDTIVVSISPSLLLPCLPRLFTLCPQAKILFGFRANLDPESDELLLSKRFKMHASYIIEMLDTAMDMLGPDSELLTEIM